MIVSLALGRDYMVEYNGQKGSALRDNCHKYELIKVFSSTTAELYIIYYYTVKI